MDPVKITMVMDQWEKQVDGLEVATSVMDSAMSNAESSTVPTSEVDHLLDVVRTETVHGRA